CGSPARLYWRNCERSRFCRGRATSAREGNRRSRCRTRGGDAVQRGQRVLARAGADCFDALAPCACPSPTRGSQGISRVADYLVGRATSLATKPPPTGSVVVTKTMGTVRLACCKWEVGDDQVGRSQDDIWRPSVLYRCADLSRAIPHRWHMRRAGGHGPLKPYLIGDIEACTTLALRPTRSGGINLNFSDRNGTPAARAGTRRAPGQERARNNPGSHWPPEDAILYRLSAGSSCGQRHQQVRLGLARAAEPL